MGLPSSADPDLGVEAFNAQLKGDVYVAPETSAALLEQRRRLLQTATQSAESFDTSFTHVFDLGTSTVSCTVRPRDRASACL